MNKLNLLLMVAVLSSGLLLVHSAYDARRLFSAVDEAHAEGRRLEADSQRLQAERRAQATNLRVETVARERLAMKPITPALTQSVDLGAASAAASGAAR
jgi:cell division protein FtsL